MSGRQVLHNPFGLRLNLFAHYFLPFVDPFQPLNKFYPPHLSQAVLDDLTALKRYILDAHSEVGHDLLISFFKWLFKAGYDGTRDFSRAFSFESTVLFTITIMSTVGCSH